MSTYQPFVAADQQLPEITIRGIVLSIILAAILAMANAYLALKAGILTSASIPAAVISMGILRFFRQSNILENNQVQTAASAGEAVAGGIAYTIPALIMVHYWTHFPYWQSVVIALLGGILGVMFSIPLRRVLVNEPRLRFPEGRAIAEVLKTSTEKATNFKYMLIGGALGSGLELLQTGFKLFASSWQVWFVAKRTIFGFGGGFSAAMIGAGYLIGADIAFSIFFGAVIGWLLGVPVVSELVPMSSDEASASVMVMSLWDSKIRYIGIGAMLCAGVWTFFTLLKPFCISIKTSFSALLGQHWSNAHLPRTDRDVPIHYVLLGILVLSVLLLFYFWQAWPIDSLGVSSGLGMSLIIACLLYVIIFGFIFCAITGYFSGLVGVTATPGSSIIIAGILLVGLIILSFLRQTSGVLLSEQQILAAEAIAIIIGAVIMGSAAIANDNIQDLKVGHILGATPWKQQVMLILGVVVSALVIPPIMQILFDVYGIAGVMPREGMDPAMSLPAPPAALMAAITQAVFNHNLPWGMMFSGVLLTLLLIFLRQLTQRTTGRSLSVLGVAIGIYLPLSSSIPIVIGGLFAWLAEQGLRTKNMSESTFEHKKRNGVLLACGLVAGAALMDVVLAFPFAIMHDPDMLSLVGDGWQTWAVVFATLSTALLGWGFYHIVNKADDSTDT